MDTYYPDIEPAVLVQVKVAFAAMTNDPLWLERNECPYDEDVAEALRSLYAAGRARETGSGGGRPAAPELLVEGPAKWENLEGELLQIYNELRAFTKLLDTTDKDQLAGFRTATSLLDKIVGLGERAKNIRAVSEFQSAVITCFDQVLTPEQRTQAMGILGA